MTKLLIALFFLALSAYVVMAFDAPNCEEVMRKIQVNLRMSTTGGDAEQILDEAYPTLIPNVKSHIAMMAREQKTVDAMCHALRIGVTTDYKPQADPLQNAPQKQNTLTVEDTASKRCKEFVQNLKALPASVALSLVKEKLPNLADKTADFMVSLKEMSSEAICKYFKGYLSVARHQHKERPLAANAVNTQSEQAQSEKAQSKHVQSKKVEEAVVEPTTTPKPTISAYSSCVEKLNLMKGEDHLASIKMILYDALNISTNMLNQLARRLKNNTINNAAIKALCSKYHKEDQAGLRAR